MVDPDFSIIMKDNISKKQKPTIQETIHALICRDGRITSNIIAVSICTTDAAKVMGRRALGLLS